MRFLLCACLGVFVFVLRPQRVLSLLLFTSATLVCALCLSFALAYYVQSRRDRAKSCKLPVLKCSTASGWEKLQWKANAVSDTNRHLHPQVTPAISDAIDSLLQLMIHESVNKWFHQLTSPAANAFPSAVQSIIMHCCQNIIDRALQIDWPTFLVANLTPLLTLHIERFKAAGGLNAEDIDIIASRRYAALLPSGRLHPAIDSASLETKVAEEKWMRKQIQQILQLIMPKAEQSSIAVNIMAREIVTCAILVPIIDLLADPDFLNSTVDEKIALALRTEDEVKHFRAALDKAPISSASRRNIKASAITESSSEKEFQSFLRSIKRTSSLADARRLRNDIVVSLKRATLMPSSSTSAVWVNRLTLAKSKADDRLRELGDDTSLETPTDQRLEITVPFIMSDSAALSYWMEFMERRQRSFLCEFYLLVQSLADPLQSGDDDGALATAAKEDASLLISMHFSSAQQKMTLIGDPRDIALIRHVAEARLVTKQDIHRMRRAMNNLALACAQEMTAIDLKAFQKTDFYLKLLSDLPHTGVSSPTYTPSISPNSKLRPKLPLPRNVSIEPQLTTTSPPPSFGFLLGTDKLGTPVEERAPLFEEEIVEERDEEEEFVQVETIVAIQDALASIIAGSTANPIQRQKVRDHTGTPTGSISGQIRSVSETVNSPRVDAVIDYFDRRIVSSPGPAKSESPNFTDLSASTELNKLTDRITALQQQSHLIASLMKERSSSQESRILRRSLRSIERELKSLETQRDVNSENELIPGKTQVFIRGTNTGSSNGKDFVLYLIEVLHFDQDALTSGYFLARRYSEFWTFYNALKDKFASVRHIDFPSRTLIASLSVEEINARRVGLEKWLQALLKVPSICASYEMRSFLSQRNLTTEPVSRKLVSYIPLPISSAKQLYRTFSSGVDEAAASQSMIEALALRLAEVTPGLDGTNMSHNELVATSKEILHQQGFSSLPAVEYFTAPVCDFLIELFELGAGNNWLRRQAITIVLQQVLGGTIERRMRDTFRNTFKDDQALAYIHLIKDSLFPEGRIRPKGTQRSSQQKVSSKKSVKWQLDETIPDLVASVTGRTSARAAARTIFCLMQNKRLTKHIIYIAFQEVVKALFPEVLE